MVGDAATSTSEPSSSSSTYSFNSRPSLAQLPATFEQHPGSLPEPLLSRLRDCATRQQNQQLTSDEYEKLTVDIAQHRSSFVQSQMAGRHTSEAAYSPQTLGVYDAYVWGFNAPFLWRLSEEECRRLYEENVSRVHCEVAVGTGLFLASLPRSDTAAADRSGGGERVLTLIDLNEHSLNNCAERVEQAERDNGRRSNLTIKRIRADISDANSLPAQLKGSFKSVGANFLFHCLHGNNLLEKRVAFENCALLLLSDDDDDAGTTDDDGTTGYFFGSTILGKDLLDDASNAGKAAVDTLEKYNRWGVFGNLGDSFQDLSSVLHEIFEEVDVWKVGYCGLWRARGPKKKKVKS